MNIPHTLSIPEAVQALQSGKVIIYPTETFYALGGDAFNAKAVASVYRIKERSAHFPLPLIIPEMEAVKRLAQHIPQTAARLMTIFWPGPLTLLLPARKDLPSFVLSGSEYVAVRQSSHSIAGKLAKESGCILTASSANISGFPPVWHHENLSERLVGACDGVVTEEPFPKGGAPSTIVRIEYAHGREKVCIRRAGAISKSDLEGAGFVVI